MLIITYSLVFLEKRRQWKKKRNERVTLILFIGHKVSFSGLGLIKLLNSI